MATRQRVDKADPLDDVSRAFFLQYLKNKLSGQPDITSNPVDENFWPPEVVDWLRRQPFGSLMTANKSAGLSSRDVLIRDYPDSRMQCNSAGQRADQHARHSDKGEFFVPAPLPSSQLEGDVSSQGQSRPFPAEYCPELSHRSPDETGIEETLDSFAPSTDERRVLWVVSSDELESSPSAGQCQQKTLPMYWSRGSSSSSSRSSCSSSSSSSSSTSSSSSSSSASRSSSFSGGNKR